jgi:hypothetical protein
MKKIIMGLALGAIAVTGCSSEAAPKDNLASSGTASGAVPSDSATPETLTYAQDGTPNEPAPAETTPAARHQCPADCYDVRMVSSQTGCDSPFAAI